MKNRNILNIRSILIAAFLTFEGVSLAQSPDSCDLGFVNHLINIGDYEEALYILDSSECACYTASDDANYFRGWSQYSLKRLLPSAENFVKVNYTSGYYLKSHFFAAYNYTHLGQYDKAIETFSEIKLNSGKDSSIMAYEMAGLFLLQGKNTLYEDWFSKLNRNFYELSVPSDNIQKIYEDVKDHKRKSPVLAGIISGVIPGSGKFYAGKRGEAISAFIAATGLGFVTWENYRKSGPRSFGTIAFGTAFAFSYAANIYGAIVTVNILENEYNENVKSSILFNLHIPLRNTFDK